MDDINGKLIELLMLVDKEQRKRTSFQDFEKMFLIDDQIWATLYGPYTQGSRRILYHFGLAYAQSTSE